MYGQARNERGDGTGGQGMGGQGTGGQGTGGQGTGGTGPVHHPSSTTTPSVSSPVRPALGHGDAARGEGDDVPSEGDLMLAVYQSNEKWQAGILRFDEVSQNRDRESWHGRVVALELTVDPDSNALHWQNPFRLSSTQILHSEMLTCELTVDQVNTYQTVVSRLAMMARMLDLVGDGGECNAQPS